MPSKQEFPVIFERLKQILEPYAARMVVQVDDGNCYSLNTRPIEKYPKGLYFAGAQINKNYVSFYLMPVYTCPDLLTTMSEPLKKRMQGKACFNFKAIDEDLLAELAVLVSKGLERFKQLRFTGNVRPSIELR